MHPFWKTYYNFRKGRSPMSPNKQSPIIGLGAQIASALTDKSPHPSEQKQPIDNSNNKDDVFEDSGISPNSPTTSDESVKGHQQTGHDDTSRAFVNADEQATHPRTARTLTNVATEYEAAVLAVEEMHNGTEEHYKAWLIAKEQWLRGKAAMDRKAEIDAAVLRMSHLESEMASVSSAMSRRSGALRTKVV